jgi:hypothetical protein
VKLYSKEGVHPQANKQLEKERKNSKLKKKNELQLSLPLELLKY